MTPVTTRSPVSRWADRRPGAICAAVLAAGTLLTAAGTASAAPQPTVSQVRHRLDKLLSTQDRLVQQYDQAAQQLASARQRLRAVSRGAASDRARFRAMRTQIAQLATAAYENGTLTSSGALLTSNSPQSVISAAGLLTHLSSNQAMQVRQLVTAARQLTAAQQAAARTEQAVATLARQRLASRKSVAASIASQRRMLATLTSQQQAAVLGTGTTAGTYTGPTSTQAGKAVQFAYNQLGKPYVYGATGPNSYDCSGLVQAAWAAAGVAIPRTTYDQWAALPHIPMSAIQPGDLIFFDAEGHVGIYVGNNMFIDAPTTGQSVEKLSLSSAWYSSTLDGAARP